MRIGRVTGASSSDEAEAAPPPAKESAGEWQDQEAAARRARRYLWAVEAACHYARRRLDQSGSEAAREVYLARRQERREALTALARAETALTPARKIPADL